MPGVRQADPRCWHRQIFGFGRRSLSWRRNGNRRDGAGACPPDRAARGLAGLRALRGYRPGRIAAAVAERRARTRGSSDRCVWRQRCHQLPFAVGLRRRSGRARDRCAPTRRRRGGDHRRRRAPRILSCAALAAAKHPRLALDRAAGGGRSARGTAAEACCRAFFSAVDPRPVRARRVSPKFSGALRSGVRKSLPWRCPLLPEGEIPGPMAGGPPTSPGFKAVSAAVPPASLGQSRGHRSRAA